MNYNLLNKIGMYKSILLTKRWMNKWKKKGGKADKYRKVVVLENHNFATIIVKIIY